MSENVKPELCGASVRLVEYGTCANEKPCLAHPTKGLETAFSVTTTNVTMSHDATIVHDELTAKAVAIARRALKGGE